MPTGALEGILGARGMMQVLIVDDSVTNLALLSRLVQAIGCSTLTYDSPTEAL
jgi:CheY-like chemotaxis protein